MTTPWKWTGPAELEIGGKKFKLSSFTEEEFRGFYGRIADDGEILSILRHARGGFVVGTAEYANARHNLRNLLHELADANDAVLEASKDIDVFFNPPEVTKAFGRDRQSFIDFSLDFTARTYVRGTNG